MRSPNTIIVSTMASLLLLACLERKVSIQQTLDEYIIAANAHDFVTLERMLSEKVVWHLGPDTLIGKTAVMKPLRFDQGARTRLIHDNILVNGDTIDFDLLETNDVLSVLGVPELHHFPRFVIRDGRILYKGARHAPLEFRAFVDSVTSFSRWLAETDAKSHEQIWDPTGRFQYTREVAELMIRLGGDWRKRSMH